MRVNLAQLESQQRQDEAVGLVWLRSADLEDYLHTRHPRRRAGRGGTLHAGAATTSGQVPGRALEIRRPVAARGGPKLLK